MSDQTPATKKWVGWFRPLARGWREGSLVITPIEVRADKALRIPLVLTVPGSCGNAVKRNRFRRIARSYFESRYKVGELNRFARGDTISPDGAALRSETAEGALRSPQRQGGESVQTENDRAPVKALWIRLLNRHRLDHKIQLEDWIKDFESLAKRAGL